LENTIDHKNRHHRWGIVQMILSGFCFGFLGIFGKILYARGFMPGEILSLRFLLGGSSLGVYFLIVSPSRLKISGRLFVHLAVLGILGYALFSSLFFMALQGLSASLTVLLLYTYPLIVISGARLLYGEKIPRAKWAAFPLVLCGLWYLTGPNLAVYGPVAFLYGLGSAFFYAVYILASSRWLAGEDAIVASVFIQLTAGAALALLHWRDPGRIMQLVLGSWYILLPMALLCSAVAMSLFLSGLQKLKNWEASLLSTSEPLATVILAVLILHEDLSASQICGGLLVGFAFVLVSWSRDH
jgi:drug/metabolite transporter (DMT)-like permease